MKKDIELIQILWDYMRMNQKLEKADISRKNEIIKIEERFRNER